MTTKTDSSLMQEQCVPRREDTVDFVVAVVEVVATVVVDCFLHCATDSSIASLLG